MKQILFLCLVATVSAMSLSGCWWWGPRGGGGGRGGGWGHHGR
jgi:hypothetical protein